MSKWMFPEHPWPDEPLSNCCTAPIITESDLCSACKEHCCPSEIDDDEYGDWLYHKRKDEELDDA